MRASAQFFIFFSLFLCTISGNIFKTNEYMEAYLISDTGKALARCRGCGPGAYADSASVHAKIGDAWAKFKVYSASNGKIALQADNGRYLARCNSCWRNGASYSDSAFVHSTNPNASWSHWTLVPNKDGTYGLRADTGKYLARCRYCVRGGATSDYAFVHSTNPNTAYTKWRLVLA